MSATYKMIWKRFSKSDLFLEDEEGILAPLEIYETTQVVEILKKLLVANVKHEKDPGFVLLREHAKRLEDVLTTVAYGSHMSLSFKTRKK